MVSYFNLMIAASSRRTISLRCAFASGEPVPPRPVYWIASALASTALVLASHIGATVDC